MQPDDRPRSADSSSEGPTKRTARALAVALACNGSSLTPVDRYCFACDEPASSERCHKCGRETWQGSVRGADRVASSVGASDVRVGPYEDQRRIRPRWGYAAALVGLAVLVLASLRLPSAMQEVPPEEVADRATAQPTTTWTFEPSQRLPWSLEVGSWVGVVTPQGRVDVLAGNPLPGATPQGAVFDVLPNGSSLVIDEDGLSVWDPELGQHTFGPVRGTHAELSPDGGRLAVTSDNALEVWDIPTGQLLSSFPVTPSQSPRWAPDSSLVGTSTEGGFGVWRLGAGEPAASGQGRLLAVSQDGVAIWNGSTVELRAFDGRLARSWEGLVLPESGRAEFDPAGRFLVLEAQQVSETDDVASQTDDTASQTDDVASQTDDVASQTDDVASQARGLWLLEVFGTTQSRLAAAGPFTWAGDGSAVLYLENGSLQANPVEAGYRAGPLGPRVSEPVRPEDRLRIYDSALRPVGAIRYVDGFNHVRHVLEGGLVWPPSSTMSDPELAAVTRTPLIIEGATRVPVLAFDLEDHTATQLADHSIYVEGSLGPPFLIQDGYSLTALEGLPVYTDGSSVKAVARSAVELVLDVRELSEEKVLAVAGVENSLFLLAETGGRGTLYHVPLWSSVLGPPLRDTRFPEAPPLAVMTIEPTVEAGRITVSPDASTLAITITSPEEGETTSVLWVGRGLPPCWPMLNNVCHLGTAQGGAVDYSPDGHWLLVRDGEGIGRAYSTRGRGSEDLGVPIGPIAAWAGP